MRTLTIPCLLFCFLLANCTSTPAKTGDKATPSFGRADTVSANNSISQGDPPDIEFSRHHLQDTTMITGDFVLFLRPDSTRFEDYAKEDENIYEGDSDFGFAISATMKAVERSNKYKSIRTAVSDRRYVVIEDSKDGPQTIDRDTINYGVILTSKGKGALIETNLHSGDYLQDIDKYFRR
jgi:hypothetical protein